MTLDSVIDGVIEREGGHVKCKTIVQLVADIKSALRGGK